MGNTPSCNNGDYVHGLCYNRCPPGWERVPGMPYNCKKPGASPYGRGVGKIPGCPPGKVKSGALCYDDPGPDWKVEAGVAWQNCPAGMKDIGAFCVAGTGDAQTPWYLSIYMLIAAVAMVVIPIVYFRIRAMVAMRTAGMGGKRGGRTKTR